MSKMVDAKKQIMDLYWNKRLTQREVGEKMGHSQNYICLLMQKLGIPSRTGGEAHRGIQKWGGHRKCPWISESNKKRWKDPEYRKKMLKNLMQKGGKSWNRGLPREMQPKFGTGNTVTCKVCGKEFHACPYLNRKYCSRKCQGIDYRILFLGRKVTWGDKISEYQKENSVLFKLNKDPEFQRKRMKALAKKPTKPERIFMQIVERNNLPFKYVGDGKIIIGTLNPDFIHNNGEKKIIEIFGRVYHDPEKSFFSVGWKRQYFGRISYFAQFGYDCLILWDDELKNEEAVVNNVKSFLGVS